jgi:hypothetical protein
MQYDKHEQVMANAVDLKSLYDLSGKALLVTGGAEGMGKEFCRFLDLQSSFMGGTVSINNLDSVMRCFQRQEFDLIAVSRSMHHYANLS